MPNSTNIFTYRGINCQWLDAGEGETLIFLPGWGAVAKSYSQFNSILAGKFRVIVLELPGFGNTQIPKSVWGFEEYAELVNEFINSLEESHVVLSGHSFGAGVALYTAKNTKVKKLVLFDAAGIPVRYNRPKFFTLYGLDLLLDLINPKHLTVSYKVSKIFLQNSANLGYKIALARKVFDKKNAADQTIFNKITIPALLFWGDHDKVFTNEAAEELNKKLRGETVRYVSGSHNWIIFEPEKIIKYLDLI